MSFPLYLDEHVDPELAQELRESGFDVMTATEAGLSGTGIPDDGQLQYAAEHGRVLLTYDARSFPTAAQRWVESGGTHSGIVLCRRRPTAELYRPVLPLFQLYRAGDLENAITRLPSDPQP